MNSSNKSSLSNAIRAEVRRHETVQNNFAKVFNQLERVDDQQLRSGLKVYLHSIQAFCLYVACTSMASLEEIFFYLSKLTKYYEDTTDIDKRRNIQRNSGQSYLPTGKDGQPHRRSVPCLACQKFERAKTVALELKPISYFTMAHDRFTMAHDRGGPHWTLHEIQEWQQLVSSNDRSLSKWVEAMPVKDETSEATSKVMVDYLQHPRFS
ncbi:uncharacterized protein LOC115150476 [Salmo trutta]|uniref:uncharacterized protein LOC115150476 n=1 Tax=Salmo trutta TaxID=8032 RepID=UPI001130A720|nr:uncharacterized protein LOC115150476 [Salmo trutta]